MTTHRFVLVLHVVLAVGLTGCAGSQRPDTLDLKQLRIVDEKGVPQMILAGSMPGKTRKVQGSGIIFNDAAGHEIGGVGFAERNNQIGLCFDYWGAHSEAICIHRTGEHTAGLWINDPKVAGNHSDTGKERLRFEVDNGQPAVVLSDRNEKPRIRISVDASDAARIEILDGDGRVIYQLPAGVK